MWSILGQIKQPFPRFAFLSLDLVCLAQYLLAGPYKVNPQMPIGLRQSALVQALYQKGHQTGLVELAGFCLTKKANKYYITAKI